MQESRVWTVSGEGTSGSERSAGNPDRFGGGGGLTVWHVDDIDGNEGGLDGSKCRYWYLIIGSSYSIQASEFLTHIAIACASKHRVPVPFFFETAVTTRDLFGIFSRRRVVG